VGAALLAVLWSGPGIKAADAVGHSNSGTMMSDDERFDFTILLPSQVQAKAPVRGRERFLRERAFLDDLTGMYRGYGPARERPVPDPSGDFYMLDDQQRDAYSAFRHQMDREYGRPEFDFPD
jgi:hypothetical protein